MGSLVEKNGDTTSPTRGAGPWQTTIETTPSRTGHVSRLQQIRGEAEESINPRRQRQVEDDETDIESPRPV